MNLFANLLGPYGTFVDVNFFAKGRYPDFWVLTHGQNAVFNSPHGNLDLASVIASWRHGLRHSVALSEVGREILRREQFHRDCRNRAGHWRQEYPSGATEEQGRPETTAPRCRSPCRRWITDDFSVWPSKLVAEPP